MPTPYSLDLRKRVIEAYEAKEESLRQIAKRFQVSLSFVRDLTRRYRETQKIEPKPHGGGAVAKLGDSQLVIVKALVEAQPDALLSELCEHLAQKTQINVSVSTMHRAVQHLELSYKKKHAPANEQDSQRVKDLRFAYRSWTFTLFPSQSGVCG